jgi:hypothetical protein
MELFYILVISFAIIFLIIILTLIGIAMKYQDKATVFPPVANKCPDYWTIADDGKSCKLPGYGKKNVGTLYDANTLQIKPATSINTGAENSPSSTYTPYVFPIYTPATNATLTPGKRIETPISTIDFTNEAWGNQGKTDICAKKQWADNWGVNWDGITNYNSC